jgi:hypothetical protein
MVTIPGGRSCGLFRHRWIVLPSNDVQTSITVKLAYIGLDWTSIFCPLCTKSIIRFMCKADTFRYISVLVNTMRSNV